MSRGCMRERSGGMERDVDKHAVARRDGEQGRGASGTTCEHATIRKGKGLSWRHERMSAVVKSVFKIQWVEGI